MKKVYECPACGANSCEEIELNIYHCRLCDVDFDIEEMGFGSEQPKAAERLEKGDAVYISEKDRMAYRVPDVSD